MRNIILKSLILSLFITNIWSVIMFFIYYFEEPGLFNGLTTLFIFFYSCWFFSGIGILGVLISFLKFWKSNTQKVFLLSTVAFLNTFFSLLIILTALFEILKNTHDIAQTLYLINFIIPITAFLLIKRKVKENRNEKMKIE